MKTKGKSEAVIKGADNTIKTKGQSEAVIEEGQKTKWQSEAVVKTKGQSEAVIEEDNTMVRIRSTNGQNKGAIRSRQKPKG